MSDRQTARRTVVLAEAAGFCFGVRRALDMAEAERQNRFGKLTALGPIVHNEQVVRRLETAGIGTADKLAQIPQGTVILSAHGVSPSVPVEARARGLLVVDVTCPFVTKVHRAARRLFEEGCQVILLGDSGHSEVRGTIGAVEALGGAITVVSGPEEARSVPLGKRVGVVSQTTQRAAAFAATVAEICLRAPEVRAINTICGATDSLQEAAIRMARHVEVAIVIGGRNSANTRRLRELCEEQGIPAYQVQAAEEVREAWLEGRSVIGITAGASTPDWIIEEVARRVSGGELPDNWAITHPD